MPAGAILGMAGGLINAGVNIARGIKQNKLAKKAAKQADEMNAKALGYANDIYGQAQSGLSEARGAYNGRMANAGAIENDIYGNQANTISSLGRNATDSSQMLQLAGMVQGNSNQAFNQLAQTEAEDKQRRFYNVMSAEQNLQGATGNLQNYYGGQAAQAQQSANQLRGAGNANIDNGLNSIADVGIMAGMGQFGNIGGQGKTFPNAPYTSSVSIPPRINLSLPSTNPYLNKPIQ